MQRNRYMWKADYTNGPDIGLSRKNFKVPIINTFKELKETIFKEQKEGMIISSRKID